MTDTTAILNSQVKNITSDAMSGRKTQELERFKSSLSDRDLAEIDHVATEFESVFLSQMLKPMFKELKTDGPFGGGHAEEVFRGLLIDEMGKEFAATGGIGIADIVRKELIEMQGRIVEGRALSQGGKANDNPALQADAYLKAHKAQPESDQK